MPTEGFDWTYLWGTVFLPFIMILYSKYNLLKNLTNFIVSTNVELEIIASETFDPATVEEYVKKNELKTKARILVIDDKGYDLQEILEDRGYQMKLASNDEDILKEIDNVKNNVYDLVLLDIKGILPSYYPEEGYGVLKDIKSGNPEQKIIAFSNEEFSNQYSEFFHLSDGMLKKDAALPIVASKINALLYIKYKKAQLLQDLKDKLNSYNIDTSTLNEKNSITYIPKVIDMIQQDTIKSVVKWIRND